MNKEVTLLSRKKKQVKKQKKNKEVMVIMGHCYKPSGRGSSVVPS